MCEWCKFGLDQPVYVDLLLQMCILLPICVSIANRGVKSLPVLYTPFLIPSLML
jgi:hypothetical protein